MSKQIRVSDAHYKDLTDMSSKIDIKREDILNNAIGLLKKLVNENTHSLILVTEDGREIELFLSFLG